MYTNLDDACCSTTRSALVSVLVIACPICCSTPLQLLALQPELALQSEPTNPPKEDMIYVCGDSHTLPLAWNTVLVNGKPHLLKPALVTGRPQYTPNLILLSIDVCRSWLSLLPLSRNLRSHYLHQDCDAYSKSTTLEIF